MTMTPDGPILIVCADEQHAADLTRGFYEQGVNAVGPVSSAAMALALTAISGASHAILAGPTTGRRDAATLAEELSRTWGVECTLLPGRAETADDRGVAAAA